MSRTRDWEVVGVLHDHVTSDSKGHQRTMTVEIRKTTKRWSDPLDPGDKLRLSHRAASPSTPEESQS